MRYDDVAVWSGLPDTQLLEMKDEILGGEAGKNAGHDAGDQQYRKVDDQSRRTCDEDGYEDLAGVVENAARDADGENLAVGGNFPDKAHDGPTQEAAGDGIEEGNHLAGEDTAQQAAQHQHRKRVPGANQAKGKQRDNIGQTKLDTCNGDGKGNLGLHQINGEGNGCQQGEKHETSGFHPSPSFVP